MKEENKEFQWKDALPLIQNQINNTSSSITKWTPSYIMFGRSTNLVFKDTFFDNGNIGNFRMMLDPILHSSNAFKDFCEFLVEGSQNMILSQANQNAEVGKNETKEDL